jgi:hypothetical protein
MKYFLSLALLALVFSTPAFAQIEGDGQAAATEEQAAQPAIDNTGKWTEGDVKKFCYSKFEGKPSQFTNCMNNHKNRVGRGKYPGEANELNKMDQSLTRRANDTAAQSVPKPAQ